MDKKTLIAVVISVVVIIGSMIVQSVFFPTPQPAAPAPQTAAPSPAVEPSGPGASGGEVRPAETGGGTAPSAPAVAAAAAAEEPIREETFSLETNVFRVTFSNRGAVVTSIQLKEYRNADGSPVEMVVNNDTDRYPFHVQFGDLDTRPEYALFRYERALAEPRVEFTRQFVAPSGVPFTLRKTYLFKPNDYLMEMQIAIENTVNEYPALDFQGLAYTVGYGPQIGPRFQKLDKRSDFRSYLTYSEGKKRDIKPAKDRPVVIEDRVSWAAIAGKYFTVIGVPDATAYRVIYDSRPLEGVPERSSLYFGRPALKSSKTTDVFRFYIGPKKREILTRYNDPQKNGFATQDLHFEETASSSPLLGWLANILQFFLELFYRVIPNYGVAILLLTLLIKVVLWPLTQKSFESTSKMQTLNPKLTDIRERYKNNPQRMNQEIAELYKREGINPLGGCLPMLLQLPIFFALYSLLNSHFELRGAGFIPGWINDLSAPESVWNFAPFSIPIVGWQDLRILPFIMLGTTFLQSRLTQAPGGASGGQMKMMMYFMPLMFFFILYDMPSGLVLYWTAQNVLSIFQQMYINSRQRRAPAGGGAAGSGVKPRGRN
jgi:YidC/Oxa1 family membrane protein insertase